MCEVIRRLHMGALLVVNQSSTVRFSKRQSTVESSTFGSEFIALKQ